MNQNNGVAGSHSLLAHSSRMYLLLLVVQCCLLAEIASESRHKDEGSPRAPDAGSGTMVQIVAYDLTAI